MAAVRNWNAPCCAIAGVRPQVGGGWPLAAIIIINGTNRQIQSGRFGARRCKVAPRCVRSEDFERTKVSCGRERRRQFDKTNTRSLRRADCEAARLFVRQRDKVDPAKRDDRLPGQSRRASELTAGLARRLAARRQAFAAHNGILSRLAREICRFCLHKTADSIFPRRSLAACY